MENPVPTIGRIVHYTLGVGDISSIESQRGIADRHGNFPRSGEVYPMMITKVWGNEPNSAVNGQVFLDGNDVLWVTSRSVGEGEYHFQWPQRS